MRRVVVTGMGAVSPLGCGVEVNWKRLISGRSGIVRMPDDIVAELPVKIGGLVPSSAEDAEGGFDPDRILSRKDQKRADRFILLALAAAEEAINQARWFPNDEHCRERTATIIGSAIGGFPAIAVGIRTADARGVLRLSPFIVPSFLINLAASHVSIKFGFKGALGAPVAACAAGAQAIGDAVRLIRANEADVVVAGGTESCIERVSLGGFVVARALSSGFNDSPCSASRPFDRSRDGFVMSEGAGLLVLEELDHASARGATPLAEIVGYGTTADAHRLTASPEDGDGAKRSMQLALNQAGLSPRDVQHINAHATSTAVGDRAELTAIKSVFGANERVAIASTKSATGHLLGAAGGLEAIYSVLALRDQIAPATLNLEHPDLAGDGLHLISRIALPLKIEHVLSNAFGFGGVNASILFRAI
jgi:3-oxoacyl-[acyl-carrier-protein] synthase II